MRVKDGMLQVIDPLFMNVLTSSADIIYNDKVRGVCNTDFKPTVPVHFINIIASTIA